MNGKASGSRVLVTGATGFLGQFVCHELKQLGCEVVRVSRSSGFHLETETSALTAILTARPSIVIHLASASEVCAQVEPASAFRETLNMGMNVLNASLLAGAKFVGVSSRSIYASSEFLTKSGVKSLKEAYLHMGAPADALGDARRALLAACTRYHGQYQRPYAFLVLPPLYGPMQRNSSRGVGFMINSILDLSSEPEFAFSGMMSGELMESLFIQDAAKAIINAAFELEIDGIVNIPGNDPTTRGAIAKMVSEQIAYKGQIHFDDKEVPPACLLSGDLAEKLLDWKAVTPIVEGVRVTVEWLKSEKTPQEAPSC